MDFGEGSANLNGSFRERTSNSRGKSGGMRSAALAAAGVGRGLGFLEHGCMNKVDVPYMCAGRQQLWFTLFA